MRVKIFANKKKPAVAVNLDRLKKIIPAASASRNFDAAFVLGGDGWLLKVLSELSARKKDIYFFPMGENTFTKGFAVKDAENIIAGKVAVRAWRPPYLKSFTRAFNEIIIRTGRTARCIKYEVSASGRKFSAEGDGLIAATALGSSAYSAAAGGKVLPLSSKKAVITPMLSFTGRKKCITAPLDGGISVRITEKQGDVWETADGRRSRPARSTVRISGGIASCRIMFPAEVFAKRRLR